jgi:hypothetical protein
MPRTIKADGRTITVPDDATPEEINQIVGPAPNTSSSDPAIPDWRDKYTEIQPHKKPTAADNATFGSRAQYVGREAATGMGNIGAGGLGTLLHPIDTAMGIGKMVMHPGAAGEAMGAQLREHPIETIEAGVGQAGALAPANELGEATLRAIPGVAKTMAGVLTKTTPKETAELVKETKAANDALVKGRKVDVGKYFQKKKAVEEANTAAKAPVERKATMNRGIEQLDVKFQDDLKATEKQVRAQANEKYNALRAATEGQTIPSSDLASAVKEAESKIQGSSENLKIFRDILSKHPEGEPDTIPYQGAQIPKGHPLYDVLKEQGGMETPPATFTDLQGYYTELGSKLSTGNLPGDVYLATKSLQENIGNLMQKMADQSGVGPQLADAKGFYRQYMQAFRDHNSPLYKAMNATERGKAIAQLAGKDQTGIEALARYNQELARRANTVRGYQTEAKSIPARGGKLKSLPKLEKGEKPKTISAEDIQQAKAKGLKARGDFIKKRGGQIAATFGVYRILESVIHGNLSALPKDFAGAVVGYGATQTIGSLIETPRVLQFLTKPTLRDLAEVPPEMRGDMAKIAQIAAQKGIKVDPRLYAVAGGAQPKKGVAAALSAQ